MSGNGRRSFDTRWFVLALLISIAAFNIIIVTIPLAVSSWTADLYRYIETIGPGDNVLATTNLAAGQMAECYDSMVIVLRHLRAKGANVVEISTGGVWGGGMTNIPIALQFFAEAYGVSDIRNAPEYGKSLAFLGYLPGEYGGSSTISFSTDIRSVYTTDNWGTPISQFSFMDSIHGVSDFKLIVGLGGYYPGIDVYTTAGWTITAGWVTTAQATADFLTGYRIGRYKGGILGTHGGAEYELLLSTPGGNMKRLSSVFMVCVTLFALIGIVNLRSVIWPRLRPRREEAPAQGGKT